MREKFARSGLAHSRRACIAACVALALSTVVGGCVSTEHRTATPALIGPNLQFVIPGPQQLGRSVDVVQLITARYRDRIFVFEGRLKASPERVELVGLDGFGRRMLSIVWNGDYVSFDAARWLPDALKPENILADIAIVYWPEQAVRLGLAESDAVLRADQRHRSISMRGEDIIQVDYPPPNGELWAELVRYRNIAFGYELDLRSVVVEQ